MDGVLTKMCQLIDREVEWRLKEATYTVDTDEYPAICTATHVVLDYMDLIGTIMSCKVRYLVVYDFGAGMCNVLTTMYEAALGFKIQTVKLVAIEKHPGIFRIGKKYVNQMGIPQENIAFYKTDLKLGVVDKASRMFELHNAPTVMGQNVVFCSRVFRDETYQQNLEYGIMRSENMRIGTIVIFIMSATTEAEKKEFGFAQWLDSNIYIKIR